LGKNSAARITNRIAGQRRAAAIRASTHALWLGWRRITIPQDDPPSKDGQMVGLLTPIHIGVHQTREDLLLFGLHIEVFADPLGMTGLSSTCLFRPKAPKSSPSFLWNRFPYPRLGRGGCEKQKR